MWRSLIYFGKAKPIEAEYGFDQEFNISDFKFNLKNIFAARWHFWNLSDINLGKINQEGFLHLSFDFLLSDLVLPSLCPNFKSPIKRDISL